MLDDIRVRARELLADAADRSQYIEAVRAYAVEKHGDTSDNRMHAERTARYFWDARPVVDGG